MVGLSAWAGSPYIPWLNGVGTNTAMYSPNTNRAALEVWPTPLKNLANQTNSGRGPITIGTNVDGGSGDFIRIPARITGVDAPDSPKSGIFWDAPLATSGVFPALWWVPFHQQNGTPPNGVAGNGELTVLSPANAHIYTGGAHGGGYLFTGGTGEDGTLHVHQYSAGGTSAGDGFNGLGHSEHEQYATRYWNGSSISFTNCEWIWEAATTSGDVRLNFYNPADTQFISDGTWKHQGVLRFQIQGDGKLNGNGGGLTNCNGISIQKVVSADATTTGQTLVDVTGLTNNVSANATYRFKATLLCTTTAVTTGTEYGIALTGGATGTGLTTFFNATGFTNAAGVGPGAVYTVGATNSATPAFLQGSGQTGVVVLEGFFTTAGGTPTVAVRHLKVTSGTSTVKVGSTFEIQRTDL